MNFKKDKVMLQGVVGYFLSEGEYGQMLRLYEELAKIREDQENTIIQLRGQIDVLKNESMKLRMAKHRELPQANLDYKMPAETSPRIQDTELPVAPRGNRGKVFE